MHFTTPAIFLILVTGAALVGAGIAGVRKPWGLPAYFAGVVAVGFIAGLHLIGRLGVAQLWFRSPTFYLAAAILVAAAIWWFQRPIAHARARAIRFGVPAAGLATILLLGFVSRLDGHSAPLSMLLPTMSTPAPELRYVDTLGKPHALAQLRGKVVLVNFWATWCAPCRHEMPMLSSTQNEFGKNGFVVLYLSLEDPEVVNDFLRMHRFEGIQGRVAHAADYYRAGQIFPLSYLIARDGRVARRWSGRPDESWLHDAIRAEL